MDLETRAQVVSALNEALTKVKGIMESTEHVPVHLTEGLEDNGFRCVARQVLEEARNAITGDRQASYGDAYDGFERTTSIAANSGLPKMTPEQGLLWMVAVKLSLNAHRYHRDNIVDAIGYLALYADVVESRNA